MLAAPLHARHSSTGSRLTMRDRSPVQSPLFSTRSLLRPEMKRQPSQDLSHMNISVISTSPMTGLSPIGTPVLGTPTTKDFPVFVSAHDQLEQALRVALEKQVISMDAYKLILAEFDKNCIVSKS